MHAALVALLITPLILSGCERLTGAAEQKIRDAEAIGYACRVSAKVPEECMKENEAHSPTFILKGWKNADRDINDGTLDPSMGKNAPASHVTHPESAVLESSSKAGEKTEGTESSGKAAKTDKDENKKAADKPVAKLSR